MAKKANTPISISLIDVKIVLAVGICLLMAKVIPEFQTMTACITTLLCVQDGGRESGKAGLIRLAITAIGGLVAVLVVLLDDMVGMPWLFAVMIMAGLFLTLMGCKLVRVPVFNARIGGVTFILVVLTKTGNDRIVYSLFRLLSTFYGVVAIMMVTAVFVFLTAFREKK
jgi:uncharacterized membrane protein YgaE (UPF0421/DUF939 family)